MTANSHVAAAVELESCLETDLGLYVVGTLGLGEVLLGSVQACDVGCVVLVVVQSHDLLRDGGLKSLLWEGMGRGDTASSIICEEVRSSGQLAVLHHTGSSLSTHVIGVRKVREGVLRTSSDDKGASAGTSRRYTGEDTGERHCCESGDRR